MYDFNPTNPIRRINIHTRRPSKPSSDQYYYYHTTVIPIGTTINHVPTIAPTTFWEKCKSFFFYPISLCKKQYTGYKEEIVRV